MSLLNQLMAGKKPTLAGVVKDGQEKTQAGGTPQAGTKVVPQGTQTTKLDNKSRVEPESGTGSAGGILSGDRQLQSRQAESSSGGDKNSVAKKNLLTATLTAVREKAEADKADHDYLFAPIPTDFQEILDRFDGMMTRDHGILDIDLQRCRDFVKKIMVELKENPEYDNLIIDRDVHNIIKFQRRLKTEAEKQIVTKVEKAAKKSTKPKAGQRFAMDLGDLDLTAPSKPKSIQDMSDLEL